MSCISVGGDHPRVRGEKQQQSRSNHCIQGSPPRARGKDDPVDYDDGEIGITPACAGKSPITCRISARVRDHPRVRGEKAVRLLP